MNNIIKKCMIIIITIIFFLSFSICSFADNLNELENKTEVNENNTLEENSSETPSETNEELTDMDKLELEKNDIENKIEEKNNQIGIIEGELSKTLEEVEEVSCKIINKENEIITLESEEKNINEFIEYTEKELVECTKKFEYQEKVSQERLIAMYEMGEIKYLDVLLNSKSLSDFLSRFYLIGEISKADINLLRDFEETKNRKEVLSSALQEKKNELAENKAKCEKDKISLSNMQILKQSKITFLNEQELQMYNEIEEYHNQVKEVEKEIRKLALKNIGDEYIGGTMAWPVPGYISITSPFGMRTHPITGIYKLHTGVDIGAPMGADFIAANDGVVVKAGRNGAYGNMVMINHGGGISTLYAHGSEILVQEGDIVERGQAILKVGSTGYSTGPHAHFEVIVNGVHQDPIKYITSYDNLEIEKDEPIIVELN